MIKFADYTGDSFRLSGQVAKHPEAEFIVFCGVHFMAESADVLAAPHQKVILPDLAAGCSMADMAAIDQLETCWDELPLVRPAGVIPVTYINSSAAIKAFVGERGGIVCTSSNCAATLRWAFERGERVLFLPDQHLGRNTAYKMGMPLDQMVVWDPNEICGGLTDEQLQAAKLILWKGHCSVHERFTVAQIERLRAAASRRPRHRPSRGAVGRRAGGRRQRIDRVHHPPGAPRAPGHHLGGRHGDPSRQSACAPGAPEKTVLSLDQFGCLCSTMFRVSPNHLLWVLEGLLEGKVHNRIVVPDEQKHWTKVALDRMLAVQ